MADLRLAQAIRSQIMANVDASASRLSMMHVLLPLIQAWRRRSDLREVVNVHALLGTSFV